ncbi:toxin co-regulated pilus biosynthesis protein Q [Gemmobacter caeni]|uniref:Toxin co-regulated pilus biosynthesis protein Q n=2 Tax=Gemmobacter caeni TaxID=589035 RepID=A0A2T6B8M5_9RHOB|nr:toxin co-regulated pilus biosynthesis protein Q [Gemmobacter caeni]TWJ02744.1 toxin co-regulated pilus biosynthesis protein Q [Gemmobacter caeni]
MACAVLSLGVTGPALADGPSGTRSGIAQSPGAWSVAAGSTLQSTLSAWAAREGWVLVWDAPRDYRIRASARLGPDFQSAVRALADAVNMTSPDLTVTLYLGNRVIHVRDSTPINN